MPDRSLVLGLAAFAGPRTPTKITEVLRRSGTQGLEDVLDKLPGVLRSRVGDEAKRMEDRGVRAVIYGEADYPGTLVWDGKPVAPVIFFLGDMAMLHQSGVGMCGSRAVSDLGLRAASACGEEVSDRGLIVISGYAKGVDTATHLAALRRGGRTVIVLAEGFDHFRVKKSFAEDFDAERALVVSQFPPTQPWTAHAAMSRNAIIFGLGQALVVIEAGERGGTLAAGHGALKIGKPVFVLDFASETPAGTSSC